MLCFTDIASIGSTWTPGQENVLRGPYDYLMNRPGKDIRKALIDAFNVWLKVPEDRLAIINNVVALLHNSSLLIDDIEDSSTLRRGIPVAHHVFGLPQTLNTANYIYFCALQEVLKLGSPKAVEVFASELCNLHRGQGLELFWRDTLTCPTEDEYIEMVGHKTGGLFRLAVRLMQVESTVESDLGPLATLLGVIFQIKDDYINMCSSTYAQDKGFCEDLTEGKFSFPIVHAIRADRNNRELLNIISQRTTDVNIKTYAVEYIRAIGSLEYCRNVSNVLIAKTLIYIHDLEGPDGKGLGDPVRSILSKFAIQ